MYRKALTLSLAIMMGFSAVSCDRIIDNYYEQKARENYVSPYQGVWMGSFSGDTEGTLKVQVYKAGNAEVTRISGATTETFLGYVLDNGAFLNTYSRDSGFTILGNLAAQNHQPTGNWKQNTSSGTWKLVKQ